MLLTWSDDFLESTSTWDKIQTPHHVIKKPFKFDPIDLFCPVSDHFLVCPYLCSFSLLKKSHFLCFTLGFLHMLFLLLETVSLTVESNIKKSIEKYFQINLLASVAPSHPLLPLLWEVIPLNSSCWFKVQLSICTLCSMLYSLGLQATLDWLKVLSNYFLNVWINENKI